MKRLSMVVGAAWLPIVTFAHHGNDQQAATDHLAVPLVLAILAVVLALVVRAGFRLRRSSPRS